MKITSPDYFLHIDRTMSHAACCADGCQCSCQNRYYQLNNGSPKFLVFHNVVFVIDKLDWMSSLFNQVLSKLDLQSVATITATVVASGIATS